MYKHTLKCDGCSSSYIYLDIYVCMYICLDIRIYIIIYIFIPKQMQYENLVHIPILVWISQKHPFSIDSPW